MRWFDSKGLDIEGYDPFDMPDEDGDAAEGGLECYDKCNPYDLVTLRIESTPCRTGDELCGKAMKAAGFQPPFYPSERQYSLTCLLRLGIGVKGGGIVVGNVVGPNLEGGAKKIGFGKTITKLAGKIGGIIASPVTTAVILPYGLYEVEKTCLCKNTSHE